MSPRYQVSDLCDLLVCYYKGRLLRADNLQNFRIHASLEAASCEPKDFTGSRPLRGEVTHADMQKVMARLHDTVVFVEDGKNLYSIFGYFEYALCVVIGLLDPEKGDNILFPKPTKQHKADALRVLSRYLTEQLGKELPEDEQKKDLPDTVTGCLSDRKSAALRAQAQSEESPKVSAL